MDIRVIELLNGGDWACAYGEPESLARVCDALVEVMDDELAERVRDIAEWTARDMKIAVRRWGEFAMAVRYPGRSPKSGRRGGARAGWLAAVVP